MVKAGINIDNTYCEFPLLVKQILSTLGNKTNAKVFLTIWKCEPTEITYEMLIDHVQLHPEKIALALTALHEAQLIGCEILWGLLKRHYKVTAIGKLWLEYTIQFMEKISAKFA